MINPIYCFEYNPPNNQSKIIRFIDLDQIVAVGMFVEGDIIGIQIDCRHRDAPLVIEVLTEPHLLFSETERVRLLTMELVRVWMDFRSKESL